MASTPMRNVRVNDEVWLAAKAAAANNGETLTDVIVRHLAEYGGVEWTPEPRNFTARTRTITQEAS